MAEKTLGQLPQYPHISPPSREVIDLTTDFERHSSPSPSPREIASYYNPAIEDRRRLRNGFVASHFNINSNENSTPQIYKEDRQRAENFQSGFRLAPSIPHALPEPPDWSAVSRWEEEIIRIAGELRKSERSLEVEKHVEREIRDLVLPTIHTEHRNQANETGDKQPLSDFLNAYPEFAKPSDIILPSTREDLSRIKRLTQFEIYCRSKQFGFEVEQEFRRQRRSREFQQPEPTPPRHFLQLLPENTRQQEKRNRDLISAYTRATASIHNVERSRLPRNDLWAFLTLFPGFILPFDPKPIPVVSAKHLACIRKRVDRELSSLRDTIFNPRDYYSARPVDEFLQNPDSCLQPTLAQARAWFLNRNFDLANRKDAAERNEAWAIFQKFLDLYHKAEGRAFREARSLILSRVLGHDRLYEDTVGFEDFPKETRRAVRQDSLSINQLQSEASHLVQDYRIVGLEKIARAVVSQLIHPMQPNLIENLETELREEEMGWNYPSLQWTVKGTPMHRDVKKDGAAAFFDLKAPQDVNLDDVPLNDPGWTGNLKCNRDADGMDIPKDHDPKESHFDGIWTRDMIPDEKVGSKQFYNREAIILYDAWLPEDSKTIHPPMGPSIALSSFQIARVYRLYQSGERTQNWPRIFDANGYIRQTVPPLGASAKAFAKSSDGKVFCGYQVIRGAFIMHGTEGVTEENRSSHGTCATTAAAKQFKEGVYVLPAPPTFLSPTAAMDHNADERDAADAEAKIKFTLVENKLVTRKRKAKTPPPGERDNQRSKDQPALDPDLPSNYDDCIRRHRAPGTTYEMQKRLLDQAEAIEKQAADDVMDETPDDVEEARLKSEEDAASKRVDELNAMEIPRGSPNKAKHRQDLKVARQTQIAASRKLSEFQAKRAESQLKPGEYLSMNRIIELDPNLAKSGTERETYLLQQYTSLFNIYIAAAAGCLRLENELKRKLEQLEATQRSMSKALEADGYKVECPPDWRVEFEALRNLVENKEKLMLPAALSDELDSAINRVLESQK